MPRPKTRSDAEVMKGLGRVLLRKGPHDFTLADVAGEVSLAPATLVQRYGTKRRLLLRFVREEARRAETPFRRAAAGGGTPLVILRRALHAAAEEVRVRRALANSMALLVEDVRDEGLRRLAGRHARETVDLIERYLVEAAAAAELPPMEDARRLAEAVYAAWNGALIQWGLRGEGSLDAWIDAVLDPLLAGGGPRPKARPPQRC